MRHDGFYRFRSTENRTSLTVEDTGVVITSANLSQNGLGDDGHHEIGVYLEKPSGLNIDRMIKGLRAKSLTSTPL